MNDPHVVALRYRIEHTDSIDWSAADVLEQSDDPRFRLTVKDKTARFEFREHYATEEEARDAIGQCIRIWEFDAQLARGPDTFRLVFDKSEIVDRRPTPGAIRISGVGLTRITGSAKLTIQPSEYPAPPSDITLTHDAELMHHQYMEYRRGRAKLAAVANFCLTMLLKNGQGRKGAAARYRIEKSVLNKISYLSAKKGGAESRKADGMETDFTQQDRHFLDRATKAMIWRVAQEAHAPKAELPVISLSVLPALEVQADVGADVGREDR